MNILSGYWSELLGRPFIKMSTVLHPIWVIPIWIKIKCNWLSLTKLSSQWSFLSFSAIDIYVWVCFSFVILSLLEFALADYWNQTEVNQSKNSPSRNTIDNSSSPWPKKAVARSQTTSRNYRYYHSTGVADADGIVHHNCSNCGPPRGQEMSNLLTNNNDMPQLPTDNGHKGGEDFVCELSPVGETSQSNGPSQTRWFMDLNKHRSCKDSSDPRNVAPTIDLVARWIFPTSFLIFNIIYWYIISWHLDANF